MKKGITVNCVTALLILLFAYTSASKLLDNHRFVFQMALAPLPLMKMAAPILGYLVPFTEITIVFLLMTTKLRFVGLLSSLVLLGLFEIYIIAMLLSGFDLPCSCGGIISNLSWKQHLVFNAIFIGLTLFSTFWYRSFQSGKPAAEHKNLSRA